jgi:hypothetical protein
MSWEGRLGSSPAALRMTSALAYVREGRRREKET